MTVTYVDSGYEDFDAAAASRSVLTTTPSAGDLIVCCEVHHRADRDCTGVTDQNGDSFTQAIAGTNESNTEPGGSIWYKVADGDETAIDLSYEGNARHTVFWAIYSGLATASPLDGANRNETYVGTSTTSVSTNAATATTDDGLAIYFVCNANDQDWNNTQTTAGSVLEQTGSTIYSGGALVAEIYASAGSKSSTLSTAASGTAVWAAVAVFKAAAGGGDTGSGSASAQSATASGSGAIGHAGSGTPQSGSASASGTGSIEYAGSGAVTAQASTASGTGSHGEASAGTGSAQSQQATAAGSGAIGHVGTGSPQAGAATATGAGSVAHTGTGSASAKPSTAAGTGASQDSRVGSGDCQAQAATASGAGTITYVGAGAAAANDSTATGSATVTHIGTGAVQAQAATAFGFDSYQLSPVVFDVAADPRQFTVIADSRAFEAGADARVFDVPARTGT